MKKSIISIIIISMVVLSMGTAFAFNWNESIEPVEEYDLRIFKYSKIDGDLGVAYNCNDYATAEYGDIVYFDIVATDSEGNAAHPKIELYDMIAMEQVGNLHQAKVIGDKPYVKISITSKTDIDDLWYKGKKVVVSDGVVDIGNLSFVRTTKGLVFGVTSKLNTADMLRELSSLGINIDDIYDGKVCMSDDILIANFGKIQHSEAVAYWYNNNPEDIDLFIPKTGAKSQIIIPVCVIIIGLGIEYSRHKKGM